METKPSELTKNIIVSIRMNEDIKKKLKNLGVSVQTIVDTYINNNFELILSNKKVKR